MTTVADFNRKHPVGTLVRYYPVPGDRKIFIEARTRAPAHISNGRAYVRLAAGAGTQPLDKIEPAPVTPEPVF